MSESGDLLLGTYVALRRHLEGHRCSQCAALYSQLLEATEGFLRNTENTLEMTAADVLKIFGEKE